MSKVECGNKIIFRFKGNEYILDCKLRLNTVIKCLKLQKVNTSKEIAKMIICEYNIEIKECIDLLNKRQILYILNKFIESNHIEYKKIYNYDEFIIFLKLYNNVNVESAKKGIEEFSRVLRKDMDKTMAGVRETVTKMSSISNVNFPSVPHFSIDNIVPKLNLDGYLNSMNRMSEIIAASVPKLDIEKIMPKINFAELMNPFVGLSDTLTKLFENLDFQGLKDSLDGYRVLLIELGYPYVDIDMRDVRYIYEQRNNENIYEIIEEIIIKNYPEEYIIHMLEKWRQFLFVGKRIRILEQAIIAYNKGLYAVSIPVFFSQLEGTIADFFEHKSSMGGHTYNQYIGEIFSKNETSVDMLNEVTKTYFSNYIFEKFIHGGEIPKFSRHAILHGGDVNYDTKINNLKIIIIFDTMVEYMNTINIES